VPSRATDGRGRSAPSIKPAEAARPADAPADQATDSAKPAAEPPTKTAEVATPAVDPAAQPADPAAKPAAPERPKQARRKRDPNYARNRNQPVFPFFGFLNFGQRG
jgi:hypothetical protein